MASSPPIHRARTVRRRDSGRPNSYRRGYTKQWYKLRDRFIRDNPLCIECRRAGAIKAAEHVDHIIPTQGVDDPNHFDEDNLQSLCASCHSRKTVEDTKAGTTRQGVV